PEALAGGPNRGISRLVLPDRRDPQPMPDARPIHELHGGCRVGDVLQPTGNPPAWIVPDAHDRARVHAGRSQEPVAILARLGQRPLVGANPGFDTERLEDDASKEAAPGRDALRARHATGRLV